MDSGTRGWLYAFARANEWRLAPAYELDDLVQDGFLVFLKIKNRYPHANKPAHLMALFKTSYTNYFIDLERKHRRRAELFSITLESDLGFALADCRALVEPDTSPELASAPLEFRRYIAVLNNAPELIRAPYERREFGVRETRRERESRLVGQPTRQLLPRLHHYLTEALAG
jgi:DNA-directed RNA polymerase specialized sigma24 family protein